ncbi:hypothetical protein C7212DRAFT_323490 [Tuber magnatum]|uniref:Uncharacterized protein n=1 Tax=Tuber magnatum TaxID=42249 RepID=A0A317SV40_9PEZI|nr:hypothetical protein C7212DRAFT_323490 [Tuber magnatum]
MGEGAGKDSGKEARKVGERRNGRGTIWGEKRKEQYGRGKKGLLLYMDVKGGYENVGVEKVEERLKGLGIERYLSK